MEILGVLSTVYLVMLGFAGVGVFVWCLVGNVGGALIRDAQTRRDGKPGFVEVVWTKPEEIDS